jgi:hypothetical protein
VTVVSDDATPLAPLAIEEAEEMLDGLPLVPCLSGNLPEMKTIRDRCLAAGIPVVLGCPSPTKSCGARTHILVEEDDVPRVAAVLRGDWRDALVREGLAPVTYVAGEAAAADGEPEGDPPCPACGHAAPLVEGACADCGLHLEA